MTPKNMDNNRENRCGKLLVNKLYVESAVNTHPDELTSIGIDKDKIFNLILEMLINSDIEQMEIYI